MRIYAEAWHSFMLAAIDRQLEVCLDELHRNLQGGEFWLGGEVEIKQRARKTAHSELRRIAKDLYYIEVNFKHHELQYNRDNIAETVKVLVMR